MKSSTVFLLLVVASWIFACNSPILDHANAEDIHRASEKSDQKANCPLRFPGHSLCAELVWDRVPNDQDAASFVLRFWNASEATASGPYTTPVDSAAVKLWMPAMGHGSSPVSLAQATDSGGNLVPGVFYGHDAYFLMEGTWQVKVQLKQGSVVTEEATLNVQI